MKEYLSDLLTEFDEMGYCPTTLCLDGEEQAIAWKKEIVEEINKLKRRAEVAELALELLERGECPYCSKEYYIAQAEMEIAEEQKND